MRVTSVSKGFIATYLLPGRRCAVVAVDCFGVMDSEEAFAVPALSASCYIVSVAMITSICHLFARGNHTVHRSYHSCLTS